MKSFQFYAYGNWAHFKKPETNNNPLTHDFITKTALIGLIGAVLGYSRYDMKPLFPQLSEDLLYGVQILNPVKKESWGFTMRRAVNRLKKAPKYLELLKNPSYLISLNLLNERSYDIYIEFLKSVKSNESKYTPVFGLHNCPANLKFRSEGNFSELKNGNFKAKCFISKSKFHKILKVNPLAFRIGLDKIPLFQNDDFWNIPDKYLDVIYTDSGNEIEVEGDYYEYEYNNTEEKWWII